MDIFNYRRRPTHQVRIGCLTLGAASPIRIQSMANTDTNDLEASVAQAQRIIAAGGELVRFTAQGTREAESLRRINDAIAAWQGSEHKTPLVADIHFQPRAADVAAQWVEKVRINPGNYVDTKRFEHIDYTDAQYADELRRLRQRFLQLLAICRRHHTALRIGVNHGSLSDRIMSRYGDTPRGMVESCMEFLRICVDEHFDDVVLSIKASNTAVMVETVRLLCATMDREGMTFPLHLGVTEAGDGDDGRIKSAVGIGALLADGIGDTLRVSLSESPEAEIPVARELVRYISHRAHHPAIQGVVCPAALVPHFRRATLPVALPIPSDKATGRVQAVTTTMPSHHIGGTCPPIVVAASMSGGILQPDSMSDDIMRRDDIVVLHSTHVNPVGEIRAAVHAMMLAGDRRPVVVHRRYEETSADDFKLHAAADMGVLLIDGLVDGLWLDTPNLPTDVAVDVSFAILQAARCRFTHTEYISCPGCGRTLYDLQTTLHRVKEATSHLQGLKIAVMGCIVNGPGEMADADYGYVGAARGHISLYKGSNCVAHNIPESDAVNRLVDLIKENGDWTEAPTSGTPEGCPQKHEI